MSDRPLKATLIMPTYRRGHAIHETVATIVAQTYPHWELIVSNNGADHYEFDDERIRVIDSREVTSAAFARNKAVPLATGDLVGFFDDDDEMFPDYLASFVAEFAASDTVLMVKCAMIYRGTFNDTFGTPTALMRRAIAQPIWQGVSRQDQQYYAAIRERYRISEENGTLRRIPRPLCRANRSPVGGLREGNL